jgi:Tol biopolymer transport system component
VRMESGGYMSFSLDGKYLCDTDWDTGNLVLRELATGNERPLTGKTSWEKSDGYAEGSAISRDSKRVAFLWWNSERDAYDLRAIGLDGSGNRVVRHLPEEEWFEPAAWSADSKRILGTLRIEEKPTQVAWVSTEDGSMGVVKTFDDGGPGGVIDLSPDGRYIAYELPHEKGSSKHDIFAFAIEQNREIPLVQHPANDKLMGWTPDGNHIFFTSDRMGSWDGWVQRASGGEPSGLPELVKASMGDVSPIGFTSAGSFHYALTHRILGVYIASMDLETGKVLSSPKPVRHTGTEGLPDWSPDGKYLAYCTRPRGEKSQIIHIRSVETGQERELDAELPYFRWLRWSPDGRAILVTALEEKDLWNVVYRIDVDSGKRTVLLHAEGGRGRAAALSPDGKALFYSDWGPAPRKGRLMVRDLETGREKELLRGAPFPLVGYVWALSPDGKWLAFISRLGGVETPRTLNIVSTTGGEPKELLRKEAAERPRALAWTPNSQHLLFLVRNELWRIPVEGGEARKLWQWEKGLQGMKVHPDGQRIAF